MCSKYSFFRAGGQTKDYDPTDSSVVPSKRLPQHTEFMANNYAFPAKPRNQWELGVKLGTFAIAQVMYRTVFPRALVQVSTFAKLLAMYFH